VKGFVSLVGAGPGDPDLLTLKAVRRLRKADLVLFDALVSPRLRRLAPRGRWFCVGKRAGTLGFSQDAIHRLLIKAARRGQRVVRLKGGDPFVFGRGGEEALALAAAGVPFEVVPGVTAATAAPALAGIPVTHRGLVSGFVVVSGHAEAAFRPVLEGLPPHAATVVVLMGLTLRATLASVLLGRGWEPRTPAAILQAAASRGARSWLGRLQELGTAELPLPGAPGTIVVGRVVSLAGVLGASQGAATGADAEPGSLRSTR
jgi:uroporphyrin-III C-methyltransferase/precorrin-2 dehydrogenase/sirohydrochlorin ferrochelatase